MALANRKDSCTLAPLQTPPIPLREALHNIAQPLTVLAALLAEAGQAAEPALAGDHLAIASRECHRVVAAVRSLQVLSARDGAVSDTEVPR